MNPFPHLIWQPRGVPQDWPHVWGYSGACAPGSCSLTGHSTFSVGVFAINLTADGKRKKRGPVVKRFSGPMSDPESVYLRAERFGVRLEVGA